MKHQAGFTLFELMIAIAVIAILSAIAIPSYQGYVQKAALTDVLQTVSSYRTATELCYLDEGNVKGCSSGLKGVPNSKTTRYISTINVTDGVIAIAAQAALQGLTITLTPKPDSLSGQLSWQRSCTADNGQEKLVEACNNVFRFDDAV